MAGLRSRIASLAGRAALMAFGLAIALAVSEASVYVFLTHPRALRHAPGGVASHVRAYYLQYDRVLLQAQHEASRYDDELFYTLREGTFRFRNRDFDVVLHVNHKGLRDDGASLEAPEIIVLGDSFAMGWGVAQNESFPERIEALSGHRVLNAGIPSFGTVRERRLLDRLDTSRLRWLVVQYNSNDAVENAAFRDKGDVHETQPRVVYRQVLEQAAARRRYWPGKATSMIVARLLGLSGGRPPTVFHATEEAQVFLHALERAGRTSLDDVQVVAVPINGLGEPVSPFCREVVQRLAEGTRPNWIRRMIVLDLTGMLGPEHYFDLDDHLNARGHDAVAAAVYEILGESEPPDPPRGGAPGLAASSTSYSR